MSTRTWMVSELFYPDETSTGYIMTAIARVLAEDLPLTVICADNNSYSTKQKQVPNAHHLSILRVKTGRYNKNRLVSRSFGMIWLTLKIGWKLYRTIKAGDRVILVTNPAPLLVLASWICRIKKVKLFVIAHDVFPENLISAGLISANGFVYKWMLRFFNNAYKSAHRIIVLGRDMAKVFKDKLHISGDDIVVITNWADTDRISPLAGARTGKIKLQFAGNFGRLQGLLPLIKAIQMADNTKIEADFIGSGAMQEAMEAYVDKNQLDNIRILPSFRRSEEQQILNNCDACFVSLSEGMYGLGVPSKTYNIMAAGKPVIYIGHKYSEVALMINEHGIGWVFEDYGDQLIAFLNSLSESSRTEFVLRGEKARSLAEKIYAKEKILNQYKALMA